MEQKSINFPITQNDFQSWEIKILKNNDETCSCCDGELKTNEEIPFSSGIFYVCTQCDQKYKKVNYTDFRTEETYFILEKI